MKNLLENDNLNVTVSCNNWYQGFGLLRFEAVSFGICASLSTFRSNLHLPSSGYSWYITLVIQYTFLANFFYVLWAFQNYKQQQSYRELHTQTQTGLFLYIQS